MKGHIAKRKPGVYKVTLEMGRDADGKRRQRAFTVHGTKKDAERELTRLLREMDTGAFVEPARMQVGDYLERWLTDYARQHVSAKSYERYQAIVRQHLTPAFAHVPLAKLSPLHVEKCYAAGLGAGLAGATVRKHHNVLHAALQQAIRWRLLAVNPADAVEPPKVQRREMRALTEGETAGLLRAAEGTPLFAPVFVAVTTGLRRGELLALRWTDVDLAAGAVSVQQAVEETGDGLHFKEPKTTRSRRRVPLPALTTRTLLRHRAEQAEARLRAGKGWHDSGLVFTALDGGPCWPSNFERAFRSLKTRAGLDLRFHDLRHTHASQLLRQGVHPKVVSERLGHASVSITLDIYSHVLPGLQEEAVAKLDDLLAAALNAPADAVL